MHKSQPHHQNHGKTNPHGRNNIHVVLSLSKPNVYHVTASKEMLAQSKVLPTHFYSQMLAPKSIHKH